MAKASAVPDPERFYCSRCKTREGDPFKVLALEAPIVIFVRCRCCSHEWAIERGLKGRTESPAVESANSSLLPWRTSWVRVERASHSIH